MVRLNAKKYWEERAETYRKTMDSEYHKSRIAMIESLLRPGDLAGNVLDFGCGDGVMASEVAQKKGTVTAVDVDKSMTETTRTKLGKAPNRHQVIHGGVDVMGTFKDQSFDTVLALNVIAYMDPRESEVFYKESARVLKSDGVFIVTHSNELFDMFTFNKYTVAFFYKHFGVPGIEKLIRHPEKPDRRPFPTRENPLSFCAKMLSYGFREEKQEFAIPHEGPPLLDASFDPDDLGKRKVPIIQEVPEKERWKLLFQCSIFGSRLVRNGASLKLPKK